MQCPNCGFQNQKGMGFCGKCGYSLESCEESFDSLSDALTLGSVSTSPDFVGRQNEFTELLNALRDAGGGQGRLVMLVGEPGIGKTRIAWELASIAEQQGAQVLWGRCYEEQGTPPFWPWIQPIRSYIQQADAETLLTQLGNGAADIADFIPDISSKLSAGGQSPQQPSPQLEPEQARFRLFNSITTFLKNASLDMPLVLILEDLHWADRSSLLLLEFLAREMGESRLLLIGTYRDIEVSRQHPLSQTLGALMRESASGGFRRVQLRGWDQGEVSRFVENTTEINPHFDMVKAVHERTDGNPLFVGEVVKLLGQEGMDWRTSIPEGIRDAIGRRLDRLSDECNQALTIASVVGREFSLNVMSHLIHDLPENRLLDILDEAVEVGVIEELSELLETYQFSHALIQETLASELSAARRVRLHARIAETMEKMHASDIEAHVVELAHHFFEASSILGTNNIVTYSLMAGEQALKTYAFEEALVHFQKALDVRRSDAMDDELATIKFGIGRAMAARTRSVDETQVGWDAISQAFDYYVEQGDIDKAVNLVVHSIPGPTLVTGVARLFARALELVPEDSLQAGYLLRRHAQSLDNEFADVEGSRNALMESMGIARRENDEVLEARCLAYLTNTLLIDHQPQEAIEAGLKAVEITQRIGDLDTEDSAQWYFARAFLIVGEPDRSRTHANAASRIAEKLGDRQTQFYSLLMSALCAAYQGDLVKAKEVADQSLKVLPPNELISGLRAWISLQSSDVEAARQLVHDRFRPPHDYIYSWLIRTAYETNGSEFIDMGEEALAAREPRPNSLPRYWVGQCAAVAVILRNDTVAASEYYQALAQDKGTVLFPALFSVDHVLGLLAQTMGNLDDAVTHFEEAIAFCRKASYRPEQAWTCYDYAALLVQRNRTGDLFRARELVDEADKIISDLDMKPLKARAVAVRKQLDAWPLPIPKYPDGLTEREVEVLRLVASGKSNADIAADLVLSVRTVERHISNIYNKTGTRGRVEATAFAFTYGLITSDASA